MVAAATSFACGGDDSDIDVDALASQTSTAGASASSTAPAGKAVTLAPDLADRGYAIVEQGRDPASQAGSDTYKVQYVKGTGAVQVTIYWLPDVAEATALYTTLAPAMKNPPPGAVGAAVTFSDAAPPEEGDQNASYATASTDSKNNRIWTDVTRFGQAVTIVQVLDQAQDDQQLPLRNDIATQIAEKAR